MLVSTLCVAPSLTAWPFDNGHIGNFTQGFSEHNTDDDHSNNSEVHGVHLASWNFAYVAEPLIFGILVFVVGLLKLGESFSI